MVAFFWTRKTEGVARVGMGTEVESVVCEGFGGRD